MGVPKDVNAWKLLLLKTVPRLRAFVSPPSKSHFVEQGCRAAGTNRLPLCWKALYSLQFFEQGCRAAVIKRRLWCHRCQFEGLADSVLMLHTYQLFGRENGDCTIADKKAVVVSYKALLSGSKVCNGLGSRNFLTWPILNASKIIARAIKGIQGHASKIIARAARTAWIFLCVLARQK
eukprot:1159013-Pelagomonas_calceolata.AAC.4